MANSSYLIKNGITEVVYKFVNDTTASPATFTVTLASLARSDQAIIGTATANISDLSFNAEAGANIKISRNSNLQYYLTGTGNHSGAFGNDKQNNTSDIVVVMGAGTLIMRILKGSEYNPV